MTEENRCGGKGWTPSKETTLSWAALFGTMNLDSHHYSTYMENCLKQITNDICNLSIWLRVDQT